MKTRTYSEISKLKTFEERFAYLELKGVVGNSTFGYDRFLNQILYKDPRWLAARDKVIIRDDGNDLGCEEYKIFDKVIVHHMNPITIADVENEDPKVFDPEYLIATSDGTHKAVHYGDVSKVRHEVPVTRTRNDTSPWKK